MSGPVDIAVLIYLPSDVHIDTAKTCRMIEHMLMHIYMYNRLAQSHMHGNLLVFDLLTYLFLAVSQ